MKKKGMLCLLLAVLLAFGCSCGGQTSAGAGSSPEQKDAEVVSLRFPLIVDDELPENIDQVEDALNDYLTEQIGSA